MTDGFYAIKRIIAVDGIFVVLGNFYSSQSSEFFALGGSGNYIFLADYDSGKEISFIYLECNCTNIIISTIYTGS